MLRQQIQVLQRGAKRARLEDADRMFWISLRRFVRGWREMLFIVQPESVIRWHRRGFRYYWRKRSTGKPGRPPLARELVSLIQRLSVEDPFCGAPRIQSELALLGHRIGETTVGKYMVRGLRDNGQTWQTFLRNHMSVAAACDFFTVPTLTFKMLYVSECGAVAFVQRFGSALNLNPHLHVLVLDGVYARLTPDGPLLFHRLPDPTDAEIGKLLTTLRKRLANRFRRVGLLPPKGEEQHGDEPPLPFESEAVAAPRTGDRVRARSRHSRLMPSAPGATGSYRDRMRHLESPSPPDDETCPMDRSTRRS